MAICADQPLRCQSKNVMPSPVQARCAAGGMTTSLGNGTMELSTAISNATAQSPHVLRTLRYQSTIGCKNCFMRRGFIAQSIACAQTFYSSRQIKTHLDRSRCVVEKSAFDYFFAGAGAGAAAGLAAGSAAGAG